MKIQSRPAVKQSCEPIVEAALSQMLATNVGGNSMKTVIPLDQHEHTLKMILNTLLMTKVLTHYEIGQTRETKASTYENTEWLIRIKFTDDPTKKTGYVADLLFNYHH